MAVKEYVFFGLSRPSMSSITIDFISLTPTELIDAKIFATLLVYDFNVLIHFTSITCAEGSFFPIRIVRYKYFVGVF